MSFILDALKKSETERQQSGSSEFAGVPSSPGARTMPRWLLVVGFLLAVNLAVLIGILLRTDKPADRPGPSTTVAQPQLQQSTSTSFEEQLAEARQKPPVQQQVSTQVETHSVSEPDLQAVLISQDPESVPSEQLYPSIQEIRAGGGVNLPELHLDIHVYSPIPKDRFVFINMAKLREGSTMDEGPSVVEITPGGVVLRYREQSFVVPRE